MILACAVLFFRRNSPSAGDASSLIDPSDSKAKRISRSILGSDSRPTNAIFLVCAFSRYSRIVRIAEWA